MAYARDAISPLMGKYDDIVKQVFKGELKVFGSENLDIYEAAQQSQSSQPEPQPNLPASPELSETSADETDTSSEAETGRLAARTLKLQNAIQLGEDEDADYEPWLHRKLGTVHVRPKRAATDVDRFLCGRPVTEKFDKAGTWSMIPKCHTCFLGVPARDD